MKPEPAFVRIVAFGLLGGVAGTVSMDIVIVVTFLIAGLQGDGFFDIVGSKLGHGSALGIAVHNFVGLTVGFIFAMLVLNVKLFGIDTRRKGLILGVSIGAVTIPAGCIPLAIWLDQPILEVVAFSTIPHLVYGIVLGMIVTFGILSASSGDAHSAQQRAPINGPR